MDNKTRSMSSGVPDSGSLDWNNNTETVNPSAIYVFTPAGFTAKLVLCVILSPIGAVGFLGNSLIFFFLWKHKSKNPIYSSPFKKNLNMYVRSLSVSDVLCCVVSLPFVCIQMFFDIFQSGWPCKIARYFNTVFPVITINNLVVISLEKYLSTRKVPRTFSVSTVRKMIICAWVLGLVVSLFPSVAYDGIRVNLNNTHFTVVCRYDRDFYPFILIHLFAPIQYVLPSIFVIYTNICLLKTVLTRRRWNTSNVVNDAFKAHLRAQRIKGTTLLEALTFTFILPYFGFVANRLYTETARPQRDFSTDYMIRYSAAGITFCSSVLNFIIYLGQMKEFRVFLKKLFCKRNNEINPLEVANGQRRACSLANPRQNVNMLAEEKNAVELRQLRTFNPI